jgi:bifunctional DNA-binding transcriptional regulator/antitoxin component of YhaV-PrlF toxin-antitoxin module
MDKSGRVVIPLEMRQRAGLEPGAEIESEIDDLGIRLARAVPGPRIVVEGGRLLARPITADERRPEVDISAWIEQQRQRSP